MRVLDLTLLVLLASVARRWVAQPAESKDAVIEDIGVNKVKNTGVKNTGVKNTGVKNTGVKRLNKSGEEKYLSSSAVEAVRDAKASTAIKLSEPNDDDLITDQAKPESRFKIRVIVPVAAICMLLSVCLLIPTVFLIKAHRNLLKGKTNDICAKLRRSVAVGAANYVIMQLIDHTTNQPIRRDSVIEEAINVVNKLTGNDIDYNKLSFAQNAQYQAILLRYLDLAQNVPDENKIDINKIMESGAKSEGSQVAKSETESTETEKTETEKTETEKTETEKTETEKSETSIPKDEPESKMNTLSPLVHKQLREKTFQVLKKLKAGAVRQLEVLINEKQLKEDLTEIFSKWSTQQQLDMKDLLNASASQSQAKLKEQNVISIGYKLVDDILNRDVLTNERHSLKSLVNALSTIKGYNNQEQVIRGLRENVKRSFSAHCSLT